MAARQGRGWAPGTGAFAAVALAVGAGRQYEWDGVSTVAAFREPAAHWSHGQRRPTWPHALTLALDPPYAIFFEGGTALIFILLPGVTCVFSAKVLGASISFWIERLRCLSSSLSLSSLLYRALLRS
ncbi:uncharacterized protein LOC101767328 [Setaria italica]|uniref:uncharacterized protein LOC101767328 n=1 Tax=Setaria italica TaxID=4555 RepID=UPI0003511A08|nr:uncharacterized protein LOC101767328 [Setaria italica]XP_034570455.1 uncharacterized protein LOC117835183 [Setaria viridis]